MARFALPAFVDDALHRAFLGTLLRNPVGKATVLRSLADEEGGNGGELDIFAHMLDVIEDDEVKKLVRLHKSDEERHEQLFLAAVRATGAEPLPIPNDARLLYRLDAHLGFFTRPIVDRAGVADAYLLLHVIEERALRQFARDRLAFADVGDAATVRVLDEVSADEERHLRYCEAIARKMLPDDDARGRRLAALRALEAKCFAEVQTLMFARFVDAGLVDGVLWRGLAALARRDAPAPLAGIAAAA